MFAKPLIKHFALTALLVFPLTTWAGADTGFYLGAALGQATIEEKEGSLDFKGSDTAYKLIAGYNFGIIPLVNVAVEGSYVDFGKPSDDGVEIKLTGWDAFGLAGLNFGIFSIFGKLGVISWDSDISGGGGKSGSDPAYGLGAAVQIVGISLRAEIEYFDISDLDTAYMGTLGVLYTF